MIAMLKILSRASVFCAAAAILGLAATTANAQDLPPYFPRCDGGGAGLDYVHGQATGVAPEILAQLFLTRGTLSWVDIAYRRFWWDMKEPTDEPVEEQIRTWSAAYDVSTDTLDPEVVGLLRLLHRAVVLLEEQWFTYDDFVTGPAARLLMAEEGSPLDAAARRQIFERAYRRELARGIGEHGALMVAFLVLRNEADSSKGVPGVSSSAPPDYMVALLDAQLRQGPIRDAIAGMAASDARFEGHWNSYLTYRETILACAVGTAERRGPPSPLDALLPLFIRSCEAAGENRTICDCVMTAGAKVDSDLPQTPWAGRDTLDGLSALDASIGGIVRSECGVTP